MLHVPPMRLSMPLPVRGPDGPPVTILMATKNGGRWIDAQMASLVSQGHRAWSLWVSDDGSTDDTRDRVIAFARKQPRHDVRLIDGPRQGAVANFLSLLLHPDLPPGPVALCDQDDLWLPFKLERGLRAIAASGAGPVLYGAQSFHVTAHLAVTGRSRTRHARPSFGNALVQNLISGHSAILSADAVDLVRRAGHPGPVPFHDWWLYLLISGAGGQVLVDAKEVLLYRQHGDNMMGAHDGVAAHLRRLRSVARGDLRSWLQANMAALARIDDVLTPPARQVLRAAQAAAAEPPLMRLRRRRDLGLRRHGALGDAALALSMLLGRA